MTTTIAAAIRYAEQNGAQYVEAYPVAPDSPAYRFMGFRKLFDEDGFSFVKMAGTRLNVMVLQTGNTGKTGPD